jgi:ribose-phosphate pyrophosphokinase
MATALKRASAARVTAVIPYFGYSRQSTMAPGFFQPQPQSQPQTQPEGGKSGKLFKKPTSRASALLPADSGGAAGAGGPVLPATTIAAADIALLLQTAGVDQIVAVDVHVNSFGGFFRSRVPVQNLDALPAALPYFISRDLKDPVVVSSSESGVIRVRRCRQRAFARFARPSLLAAGPQVCAVLATQLRRDDALGARVLAL